MLSIPNLKNYNRDELIWYCVFSIPYNNKILYSEQHSKIAKKGNGLLLQMPIIQLKRIHSDCNISYQFFDEIHDLSGRITSVYYNIIK